MERNYDAQIEDAFRLVALETSNAFLYTSRCQGFIGMCVIIDSFLCKVRNIFAPLAAPLFSSWVKGTTLS